MDANSSVARAVYEMVLALPRHNWQALALDLPLNGIYFFFEQGETIPCNGAMVDRIVRIGTHNKDNRFRTRIRQHYGTVKAPGGSRSSSIFRKHLGAALLRRSEGLDARLEDWVAERGKFPEIEAQVSCQLRDNFTFCCVRVDRPEDRASLERGLLSLLAQHPIGRPSPFWLGRHSLKSEIRDTGLWNVRDIDKVPLTRTQFAYLSELARETTVRGR